MNKRWMIAGIAAAVVAATAAIGYAWAGFGPGAGMTGGGYGMMGGGYGMMGGGYGMMGGGACPMVGGQGGYAGPGANYNPAAMQQMHEAMLIQQKASLANLQAQLAAATDDTVKANLTVRIERQSLIIGEMEAMSQVLKSLPEQWLDGATAMANADVTYWSAATASDAGNKSFIAARLAAAQQRLAWLEDDAKNQQQSGN